MNTTAVVFIIAEKGLSWFMMETSTRLLCLRILKSRLLHKESLTLEEISCVCTYSFLFLVVVQQKQATQQQDACFLQRNYSCISCFYHQLVVFLKHNFVFLIILSSVAAVDEVVEYSRHVDTIIAHDLWPYPAVQNYK